MGRDVSRPDSSSHGPTSEPPDDDAPRATIFVADDDDAYRRGVASELRANGYHVIEAASGAEALEALAAAADGLTTMPDLVLLDVCMPGYSGLGILGVMRRFPHPPPAFLVTSFDHLSLDVIAGRRGAARIFHKPVELAELVAAVDDLLRSR